MAETEYVLNHQDPQDLQGPRAWKNTHFTRLNRAIDLVHLSRQSLGDRALERELLVLFDLQAAQIVQRLQNSACLQDSKENEVGDLAHTLRGSALAIGANRVAKAAAALESAVKLRVGTDPMRARIAEIDAAVGEAGQAVAGMLASM